MVGHLEQRHITTLVTTLGMRCFKRVWPSQELLWEEHERKQGQDLMDRQLCFCVQVI